MAEPVMVVPQGAAVANTADLSAVVIALLKGVMYQEDEGRLWSALLKLQARVRDYVTVLGLELMLDEAEGYAFLRSITPAQGDEAEAQKFLSLRLVARRPLSFPVSLLLALLRKKLAEFDARGGDTRLVLSRDELIDLIRVFLPQASNEVKLLSQVDAHLNKIVELGFLRRLKAGSARQDSFEVRRIIKAFVDAQWLADLDERLLQYKNKAASEEVDDA